MFKFVFDAIVFGLALAFVFGFGPAFFALIQTSIHRGFRSAAWFAVGVFLNDVVMVALCILTSIKVVTDNEFLFCLGAGIVLILFGVFTFIKKVKEDNFEKLSEDSLEKIKERTDEILVKKHHNAIQEDKTPKWFVFLGKGFALNILNPFVWFFWFSSVAVTAGNLDGNKPMVFLFFGIVLATSLSCDLLKAKGASFLKRFFNSKRLNIMNKLVGCGLILFGVYFIVKGFLVEPQYTINVNLANTENQVIYLQKDGVVLDSATFELDTTTPMNWKAEFNTPVCSANEMYSLMLKGWRRPVFFFTDNKNVVVEGDAKKPNDIMVTGSESQDRLVAFMASYDSLEVKLMADSTAQADVDEILKMYCFDFVWDNPKDPVAHYVMYRYKWAFGPCELRTMIDNIHHTDSTITSSNLRMVEEYVEKLERVQAGQPIIDFTQNDPDGNPVTLSQLAEGKLLLVDFWASWCPDCRKANPDVVAAYQQYHDQGFDVLGVSFDTNREKWLAAVEKDGLTWTQVSDLQGWSNAAGALYSIAFIPQNALIKDGMIVARNLDGEDLMKEIERQLQ